MSGRRRRVRCIEHIPNDLCFKPCGRQGRELETVVLRADELEALRLADLEGLYQEACAQRMGISRTTLSRTLAEARRKLADTLIHGKRLLVESETDATETTQADYRRVPPPPAAPQSPPEHPGAQSEKDRIDRQ